MPNAQSNFGTPPLNVINYTLAGQSATLGSTTAYTAVIAGVYQITGTVLTTTAGSAGTVLITLSTTKGGSSAASTATTLTTLGDSSAIQFASYLNVGDTITYTTTVAGNVGGVYEVLVNASQLQ